MTKIIKHILLVDDDEATNLFNKRLIEKSQLAERVTVAFSGIEALGLLRTKFIAADNEPDLIFLDASMPEMDGWMFAEEFKKLSAGKNWKTKVVLLTETQSEIKEIGESTVAEISGYKIKPLSEEILHEIVERYFKERVSGLI